MNAEGLSFLQATCKRTFDIFVSLFGLVFTAPIITVAWLVSSFETGTHGFFFQERVGKNGELFNVIKVKTMKKIEGMNTTITSSNDARITKSGAFFRKTKIDELPQLWNVLIGQMSLVGPRPDVTGYADRLKGEDRLILSIRPGITSPASLKYKNEEEILAAQDEPTQYNNTVIWPDKVRINREYIKNYSFAKDLQYILKTIVG